MEHMLSLRHCSLTVHLVQCGLVWFVFTSSLLSLPSQQCHKGVTVCVSMWMTCHGTGQATRDSLSVATRSPSGQKWVCSCCLLYFVCTFVQRLCVHALLISSSEYVCYFVVHIVHTRMYVCNVYVPEYMYSTSYVCTCVCFVVACTYEHWPVCIVLAQLTWSHT